jgi:hypothetical protein
MNLSNQPEEHSENGRDVVAEALASVKKTEELREAAIRHLLAQRDKIESNLKTLGYTAPGSLNGHVKHLPDNPGVTREVSSGAKRFKDRGLAEVGKIILQEHGAPLHGKEIERLAKAGGYRSESEKFQNYMPVAFKRAGGFENIGKNTWRLNENIAPVR